MFHALLRGLMERTYDIFENMPDGSLLWRAAIPGHDGAIQKLRELAAKSPNEFRLMHIATNTVIATINAPGGTPS